LAIQGTSSGQTDDEPDGSSWLGENSLGLASQREQVSQTQGPKQGGQMTASFETVGHGNLLK
jgi:hypothetical protein